MTIQLRAHHLLCVLTYVGVGYNRAFTENYNAIVARLTAGEDVVLIEGPDDICRTELDAKDAHCLRDSVLERDQHAAHSLADLLGRFVAPGQSMGLDVTVLAKLRAAFRTGNVRRACVGCEWSAMSTEIAREGYRGVRLAEPLVDMGDRTAIADVQGAGPAIDVTEVGLDA